MTNRSGKLLALNDNPIRLFLMDENYQVREDGTIWSCYSKQGHKTNTFKEMTYRTKINEGSRKSVKYKERHLQVHRIVYMKYTGELEKDLVINHKDGNPSNNNPTNLELVTQSENNKHRFRVLNRPAVYGNAKLSFEIANKIREDRKNGLKYKELMKKYDVAKGTISEIINNKIWI